MLQFCYFRISIILQLLIFNTLLEKLTLVSILPLLLLPKAEGLYDTWTLICLPPSSKLLSILFSCYQRFGALLPSLALRNIFNFSYLFSPLYLNTFEIYI